MREAIDSLAAEKKNLEESHIGLSLCFAQLSALPAFSGDLAALTCKCIDTIMAYLEVAHEEEGSRFKVHKDKRADLIYQHLVKELGPCGIQLPPTED